MLYYASNIVEGNIPLISLYIMNFPYFTPYFKIFGPVKCPIFGSKGTWSSDYTTNVSMWKLQKIKQLFVLKSRRIDVHVCFLNNFLCLFTPPLYCEPLSPTFLLTWAKGSSELFWSKFVHWRCRRKLFTFSSFYPELLGKFQPNLAKNILRWRWFKFVQMKGPVLFQGEIITK